MVGPSGALSVAIPFLSFLLIPTAVAQSCPETGQNPHCYPPAKFASICCPSPNVCYWEDRSGTPACCPYGQVCGVGEGGGGDGTSILTGVEQSTILTGVEQSTILTGVVLSTISTITGQAGQTTICNGGSGDWGSSAECIVSTITSEGGAIIGTITSGGGAIISTITSTAGRVFATVSGVLVGNTGNPVPAVEATIFFLPALIMICFMLPSVFMFWAAF